MISQNMSQPVYLALAVIQNLTLMSHVFNIIKAHYQGQESGLMMMMMMTTMTKISGLVQNAHF
jgi:hypothetical protein